MSNELSLIIPGDNISEVYRFVIIKDYNGLLRYQGTVSIEGGLDVKVICFARNSSTGFQWFETELDMSSDHIVTVEFQNVSQLSK